MDHSPSIQGQQPRALPAQLLPQKLHHAASVTRDAAATAAFYTQVLGMQMVHTVMDDRVPSTGQAFPYLHLFFAMADGSTIAFFESPCLPARAPSTHPGFEVFDHFAMQVRSRDEVDQWCVWLKRQNVDVVGPTNHGIIYSIYFHDPDGRRLELTTDLDPAWSEQAAQARTDLDAWQSTKQAALASGKDVGEALTRLIQSRKRAA